MIVLITVLGVFLNTLINNIFLIDINTYFSSFLFIPLIVLLYPLFKNDKDYLIYVIIVSVLSSSNIESVFINIGVFIILSFLIINYNKIYKNTLLYTLILNNIIILIYSFILGLILYFTYYEVDIFYLFKPFYNTLIVNNLFITIIYLSSKKIRQA